MYAVTPQVDDATSLHRRGSGCAQGTHRAQRFDAERSHYQGKRHQPRSNDRHLNPFLPENYPIGTHYHIAIQSALAVRPRPPG